MGLRGDLKDIARAIRLKDGSQNLMLTSQMAGRILDLSVNGVVHATDLILENGQISSASQRKYLTAEFLQEITFPAFLCYKAHNATTGIYSTPQYIYAPTAGSQSLTFPNENASTFKVTVSILGDSIKATNYSGSWRDLYLRMSVIRYEVIGADVLVDVDF